MTTDNKTSPLVEALRSIATGSFAGIIDMVIAGTWQAIFTEAQRIARDALATIPPDTFALLPALDPVTVFLSDGKQLERRTFAVPLGNGAVTHQWYLDGVPITGETRPSFGERADLVRSDYPAHDTTIPEIEADAIRRVWDNMRAEPTTANFDAQAAEIARLEAERVFVLGAGECVTNWGTYGGEPCVFLEPLVGPKGVQGELVPDSEKHDPHLLRDGSVVLVLRGEPTAFMEDIATAAHRRIPMYNEDDYNDAEDAILSLEDCEDPLTDAIADSLDIDWSPRDGAKAIMREDWFQTLIRIPVKTMAITRSAQSLGEQVKRLQAFKTYVHERLDAAGITTYPDGPHSAAGCRVGDRLDIALQMHEQGGDLAVAIGEHAFRAGLGCA